jgi:hypothetical protein
MDLLEAVARVFCRAVDADPHTVLYALHRKPLVGVMGEPPPHYREQILGLLQQYVAKKELNIHAYLVKELQGGALSLVGTRLPAGEEEEEISPGMLEQGNLDWAAETLAVHLDAYTITYGHLRLTRRQVSRGPLPTGNRARAAAFRKAVDGGEIDAHPNPDVPGGLIISTTKQEAFRILSGKRPSLFGSWESFKSKYSTNGEWADHVAPSIMWSGDKSKR